MLAHAWIALLPLVVATVEPVVAARAQAASTQGDLDVPRRFEELTERTNALKSFAATYRTRVGDQDLEITLAYVAPDRARLQWHGPGMNVDTWIVDGRMSLRGDYGQGPVYADVPLADLLSMGEPFESALREQFPASAAAGGIGAGPVFAIEVVADPTRPDGRSMRTQLGWDPRRIRLLSWLGQPKAWRAARREGDELVREGPAGSALALSLASGFHQWIRMRATLRLVELRVDEPVPDATFVVPPPVAKARDISEETRREQEQLAVLANRTRVYHWATRPIATADGADPKLAERLARVFGVLHAELQKRALGTWRAQTATRIDEFLATLRGGYAQAGDDSAARAELDVAAASWRRSLAQILDEAAETCAEGLVPPADLAADRASIDAIHLAEQKAARDVLARGTAAELLARFDAGAQAAARQ